MIRLAICDDDNENMSYMKEKIKRFLFFLSWYIPHESMNKRIICLVLSLQSSFYRPL